MFPGPSAVVYKAQSTCPFSNKYSKNHTGLTLGSLGSQIRVNSTFRLGKS